MCPGPLNFTTMAFAISKFGNPRRQVPWVNTERGSGPTMYNKDTISGCLDDGLFTLVAVLVLNNIAFNDVVLTYDIDWNIYSEVGARWKEQRGDTIDDIAMTVAICGTSGKWAVGFSCKQPLRKAAAYLAMAVALAADAIQLSARSKGYPSFIALCKGAGLDTEMHVPHAALSPDGNQDAPATEAETVEESATAVSILKQ